MTTAPDPPDDPVLAKVTELASQVHAQAVELALRRATPDLSAATEQILDFPHFQNASAELDAGSPDFADQVVAAAHAAQAAHEEELREAAQWTIDMVKAATPEQVRQAQDDGLLTGLGYPPPERRRF